MSQKKVLLGFLGLIMSALLLVACAQPSEPAAPALPTATEAVVDSVPTDAPIEAAPTATSTDTGTGEQNPAVDTGGSGAAEVSFANSVLPILENSCWKCHGGEKTEKGFDVSSYASLMAGSEKGAAVVVGDADNSKLVTLIESGKMPKRAPKLPDEEIQLIREWINAGALDN